jgi:hypothetical protein
VVAAGSSGTNGHGNGNGHQRSYYRVTRTPVYEGCRKAFEIRFPVVAQQRILDLLELRLAIDPIAISRQDDGDTWVTWTLPGQDENGEEVSGSTIFFTLDGRNVVLRALLGDDEFENPPF